MIVMVFKISLMILIEAWTITEVSSGESSFSVFSNQLISN
jgi:hypothetical protein